MSVAVDEHLMVLEPDWASRGLELLLWQHQGKARIEAFVRALAAGAQLAEHTSWAVLIGGGLDAAEGVTLDRWAEVIGEFRGDLDHEELQRFIALRIRVNTEHPGDNNVGGVLKDAVFPSVVTAYFVADGIVYQVESPEFLPDGVAAHAGALVRDFRPAGIYAAVAEFVPTVTHVMGSIAEPGSVFGSVSSPGLVFARLLYAGRG